jgi:predicted transglutaminase-like protease
VNLFYLLCNSSDYYIPDHNLFDLSIRWLSIFLNYIFIMNLNPISRFDLYWKTFFFILNKTKISQTSIWWYCW